jgi:hydrogenase maturation protein HypF
VNGVARLRLTVRGLVQGVGFRPFVFRLARELRLGGWVGNAPEGVRIEAEGPRDVLDRFCERLRGELPPRANILALDRAALEPAGHAEFVIRASAADGDAVAWVMPDVAACAECLREVRDPRQRRYRYPFTNCTDCGPRYSIIRRLPYDRPNTTMAGFAMCAACRAEYDDPRDRRFHAQPIACPDCGPHLELVDRHGAVLARRDEALRTAAAALRAGQIMAVKGIGGFHLLVDARREQGVKTLRRRKCREAKPLAVMVADLAAARELCEFSDEAARLFESPEAPIVLAPRRGRGVCDAVAPGNPLLGVLRAYTPLHVLLLAEVGFPLVATSGNRSDEPICTDNQDALTRLGDIADLLLVHNRPIARRVDDSVVQVIAGRPQVLRSARGYAPLPLAAGAALPAVLAVGAQQKSAPAAAIGADVFLGAHVGDLEGPLALDAFAGGVEAFRELYGFEPVRIACDLHPDYQSTRFAERCGVPVVGVQHHVAHAHACLADNGIAGPALAVVWDGTGLGTDGTIWGGEFLRIDGARWERVDHLRRFRLPGGEAAAREPRRAALGVLFELYGAELPVDLGFAPHELEVLLTMLRRGVNAPLTSSAGRLFDAVAALLDLRRRTSFEGQAAMELEFAAERDGAAYGATTTDWGPLVRQIVADVRAGVPRAQIAARFHASLVAIIVAVARRSADRKVLLTGGCFQNRRLSELAIAALRDAGFEPYWHGRVPPNDGGIALGQVFATARQCAHVLGDTRTDRRAR